MNREFDYNSISLKDIGDNEHLIFICDGDKKKVIIEREEQ